MIWSIVRLIAARRMFYLSRWLLRVGEAIVDEEMEKSAIGRGLVPIGLGMGGSLSWAGDRYAVNGEAFARTSLKDFGDSNALGAKVEFSVKW